MPICSCCKEVFESGKGFDGCCMKCLTSDI